MDGSKLVSHDDRSVLPVVIEGDVDEVVLQLPFCAVLLGAFHVGIEHARYRVEGVGMAAGL